MKYPLVEFSGSCAIRLDLIEVIVWENAGETRVYLTTGRDFVVEGSYDANILRLYKCIELNR